MFWKSEWKPLLWIVCGFLVCFYLPIGNDRFDHALLEAFHLVKTYAHHHVLLCLVPAFFIAGAIGIVVSEGTVMKYLGPKSNRVLAYTVAAVSGGLLTVCSCTMLPLFAGIYRLGAGLGPACAFLYSGPAINATAIVLTAQILGTELGIVRAIAAVSLSIVIGLLMSVIFRKDELSKIATETLPTEKTPLRPLWQNALFFASLVGILVFVNCGCAEEETCTGITKILNDYSGWLSSFCGLALGTMLIIWFKVDWWKIAAITFVSALLSGLFPGNLQIPFVAALLGLSLFISTDKGECGDWFASTWSFAKDMFPLLLFGILIAGLLLGRNGSEGLVPSEWIAWAVGGNSLRANFFASIAGAFMYFATCTEVPFVQALMGAGMGKGPALSLLLAGPTLSLPSMIIVVSILGIKKTAVFVGLVVLFSMLFGMVFGSFYP